MKKLLLLLLLLPALAFAQSDFEDYKELAEQGYAFAQSMLTYEREITWQSRIQDDNLFNHQGLFYSAQ
ncbi:MAG: hypothetical protein ACKVKR_08160 [Pseudomonadales bacterium]|jgi:hypothetical protein